MADYYFSESRNQYMDQHGTLVKDPTLAKPCAQLLLFGMALGIAGGLLIGIGIGSPAAVFGGLISLAGLIIAMVGIYRAAVAIDYLHSRERLRTFGRASNSTIAPSSEMRLNKTRTSEDR